MATIKEILSKHLKDIAIAWGIGFILLFSLLLTHTQPQP